MATVVAKSENVLADEVVERCRGNTREIRKAVAAVMSGVQCDDARRVYLFNRLGSLARKALRPKRKRKKRVSSGAKFPANRYRFDAIRHESSLTEGIPESDR